MEKHRIKHAAPQQNVRQAWRPKPVGSRKCPHCGAAVKASYAICPECGRSLTPERCSFCGAAMKETARFCTRCGQSRDGIECPECGTLNARNFCRKCNAALTPMAAAALAAAKADPAFRAVQAKADELAELHARIEEMQAAPPQLSAADRAMLDDYAAILNSIGSAQPRPAQTKAAPQQRRIYADTTASLDDIMRAYREKAAEMDAALAALTPPPDFTPEQQRDYFSARKIASKVTTCDMSGYRPTLWQCNYCGFRHNNPSECAEPQLGGTWLYITPEQYIQDNPGIITTENKLIIE